MRKWVLAALISLCASFTFAADEDKFQPHRQLMRETTFTVYADGSRGSGNIAKIDKNGNTWFLTAAHVTEGSKTVKIAMLERDENGDLVTESFQYADIMVESVDDDLALLKMRKKNFGKPVVFSEKKVKLDDPVALCGTFCGEHEKVITIGKVQDFNVKGLHKNTKYDMITAVVYKGCSGGGVFDKDGKYVGMVVAGWGNNLTYYIPLHRMKKWAETNKVKFLFDDEAEVPADLKPLDRSKVGIKIMIISSAEN